MPFYIRKGINFGPLRLNLSKSGLGVSLGIPGLRIGSGPKGNYFHAGRGGVYYRKGLPSLKKLAKGAQAAEPEATTPAHDRETGEILPNTDAKPQQSSVVAENDAQGGDFTIKWHWAVPLLLVGYLGYQHWMKDDHRSKASLRAAPTVAAEERHVAGEALSDEVQTQIDAFLDAVQADDAKEAARYVALPFTYMRDGKPRSIRTREGFVRNFEIIFTPEFKDVVAQARQQPLQLSGNAPALANGSIHFTAAGKAKHFGNF